MPVVTRRVLALVRDEGLRAYPGECCGVLAGTPEGPRAARRVVAATPVANAAEGRRFAIPAAELAKAESDVHALGLVVLGFYHSHPDAGAHPSASDREGAWPWYTYLIVPIPPRVGARAWRLVGDRSRFEPERITEVDA